MNILIRKFYEADGFDNSNNLPTAKQPTPTHGSTAEINARIEENKSLLDMAILHMDERAVMVINNRISALEDSLAISNTAEGLYNIQSEASEIETLSHGRTAEEIDISNLTDEFKADYIDACSDNRKLRKMLAEVTGLSRIATVEEYASQFKAMEEHRTQPQEGREDEINLLKKQLEKEQQDHYYTRCVWDQTISELQKLKNKDK